MCRLGFIDTDTTIPIPSNSISSSIFPSSQKIHPNKHVKLGLFSLRQRTYPITKNQTSQGAALARYQASRPPSHRPPRPKNGTFLLPERQAKNPSHFAVVQFSALHVSDQRLKILSQTSGNTGGARGCKRLSAGGSSSSSGCLTYKSCASLQELWGTTLATARESSRGPTH